MGLISTPYRPSGADVRSIAGVLNDFDTIYNEFNGAIENVNIAAAAGVSLSKLALGSSGQLIIADGSGVPMYRTVSGDATISNTGVLTIPSGGIGTTKLADNSVNAAKIGTLPACRVRRSGNGNQSIPAGALTAISFDSERFDTDTMHDNLTNPTRITFNTAGIYVMSMWSNWAILSSSVDYWSEIRALLGATPTTLVSASASIDNAVAGVPTQALTTIMKMEAGEYVESYVKHDGSAGAKDCQVELSVAWLSD